MLMLTLLVTACGPTWDTADLGPPDVSCVDVDAGSALGDAVVAGTFAGQTDRSHECGGKAQEVYVRWQAPERGTYAFDGRDAGNSDAPRVMVLDGDCSGAALDCDDDGARDPDGTLVYRAFVTLSRGDTVVVVLDGGDADLPDAAPWVLNVAESPSGG
jgi:hypothetical protein